MSAIELKNVTKKFGNVIAVDDVSLQVQNGEIFFLLGPSGCGKSTILRMIAGFEKQTKGSILINERNVDNTPPRLRRTAMVFQNYALWPHMKVVENVAYGLEEKGATTKECRNGAMKALEIVRMQSYADRMPAQLSGGQQQRVALARALAVDPEVILLDEPLSNLDARLRTEMREEIRKVHEFSGVTMVYVTHDQKEALTLADRIAVMGIGKIEQIADPVTAYERPANKFVATFLGDANFIHGKLASKRHDRYLVETVLGEICVAKNNASFQEGTPVTCMIRPENIKVQSSGENSIQAKILKSSYQGETCELIFSAAELKLKVLVLGSQKQPDAKAKDVRLSFDPEHVVLFPRGED